ncbi:MAG: glycosyltransferase family 1 protein [Beijerinckiaceae bacterium]
MRESGAALEYNGNPLGAWMGEWPRVITVHDLYLETMPDAYARRHRWAWNMIFPFITRSAGRIIVPSTSTKKDLLRNHPGNIDKISIVPEAPAFAEDGGAGLPPLSGRFGLMVGNLSPNKNPAAVVEALAILASRGIKIPILHIGRDERNLLAKACARHPELAPIKSIGGVDDATLKGAYAHAAFFVNSSLHEGFCLPIVEAQSFGTPVIASNRSAIPEVAGDGALLVNPDSHGHLAEAMALVWTNSNFASQLSRRARRNARRYSWRRTALMVNGIFDEVAPDLGRARWRDAAVASVPRAGGRQIAGAGRRWRGLIRLLRGGAASPASMAVAYSTLRCHGATKWSRENVYPQTARTCPGARTAEASCPY